MKRQLTGVAAVALLTAALGGQAWALGNVNTNLTNNMNRSDNRRTSIKSDQSNRQRIGGNATQNSHNTSNSHNRVDNSDNRSFSYSDNRQTTTIDNRDHSDRSVRIDNSRKDSHNLGDNARMNSHQMGDNSFMINGNYNPQVGHAGGVTVGGVSGSNNYVDNSISGNFGIVGHTINTGNTTTTTGNTTTTK